MSAGPALDHVSTAPAPAERCQWCGETLGPGRGAAERAGRAAPLRRRRPPTRGPPTPSSRAPTRAGTGPTPGASPGPGDALLRRHARPPRRRLDRLAPARARCSTSAPGRRAARRARGAGREAVGLERAVDAARRARGATSRSSTAVRGDRLLALARAPARRRARRSTMPRRCSRPAAPGGRGPERGQPAGARLRRPLARPRPAAPPRPPARRRRCGAACARSGCGSTASATGAAGQVVFGWLHGLVGALPGPPRPLRRDPPARGARRAARAGAGAPRPCRRRVLALPLAASAHAARWRGRGGTSTSRPAVLSRAGRQGRRRDAGAQRGADARARPSRRSRATGSTR